MLFTSSGKLNPSGSLFRSHCKSIIPPELIKPKTTEEIIKNIIENINIRIPIANINRPRRR